MNLACARSMFSTHKRLWVRYVSLKDLSTVFIGLFSFLARKHFFMDSFWWRSNFQTHLNGSYRLCLAQYSQSKCGAHVRVLGALSTSYMVLTVLALMVSKRAETVGLVGSLGSNDPVFCKCRMNGYNNGQNGLVSISNCLPVFGLR